MKKTIKFFSRTPTAINSKSHSAVQTTNEYTKDAGDVTTPAVAQQSENVNGLRALEAKVDALTAIVEKVVNQGVAAKVPDAPAEHPQAAVAQNSATVEGVAEAAKAVDALAPEADKAVNQSLDAEKPDAKTAEASVAQASNESADAGDPDAKPEGIPEDNLGAQVPANAGEPYTEVPEDDIVKQFSKAANMTKEEAASIQLAGNESFSCLFQ